MIIFKAKAGGDKRLVAHHQAGPAVVVSVGNEVQKEPAFILGQAIFVAWDCHQARGEEVSEEFSSEFMHKMKD